MPLNNLVERRVLRQLEAARRRYGDAIVENVPTDQEVSDFITHLQQVSPLPISERLHFSDRDGTVAFSHVVENPPAIVHNQFPDKKVMVRLFTVTQDYTDRSDAQWQPSSGWDPTLCRRVFQPVHIPVVHSLFDPAQRRLLAYKQRPRFLHIVRRDFLKEQGVDYVVYTVEVADRKYSEGDVNMPIISSLIKSWPSQNSFARRRAVQHEVTLWAVLNIVEPQANHDLERLAIIRQAINAVAPFCEPPPESLTTAPRKLFAGNTYQLLKVRHAAYQDGRARYAIALATVTSRAKAQHGTTPVVAQGSSNPSLGRTQTLPLEKMRDNRWRLVLIVVATLLTGAVGLLYLLRLRVVDSDGVDDVIGVAVAISLGIMVPSAALWTWLCFGCKKPSFDGGLKEEKTAEELYKAAEKSSVAKKLEVATSNAGRAYYNENWLSFTGMKYTGSVDYPGRFYVSELMAAGYKTSFALDGREVLFTPQRTWVRLIGLDDNKDAVFENDVVSIAADREDGEDYSRRVVPDTESTWMTDLKIGNKADLGAGAV